MFVNDPTGSPLNPPEKATELAKSHAEQLNAKLINFTNELDLSRAIEIYNKEVKLIRPA